MPEGPEVRRHADALAAALTPHPLVSLTARTKAAKAWLAERPGLLEGRRIESVRSRGKNLVGRIEGGYYFYSHLMMWGHWHVFAGDAAPEADRRERARIVVPEAAAVLLSAPVFEVGAGDPMEEVEFLRHLGPDTLPYPGEGRNHEQGQHPPAFATRNAGRSRPDEQDHRDRGQLQCCAHAITLPCRA